MKNKIYKTLSVWFIVNLMILPFPFLVILLIFENLDTFVEAVNSIEKGLKIAVVLTGLIYQMFLLQLCSKY